MESSFLGDLNNRCNGDTKNSNQESEQTKKSTAMLIQINTQSLTAIQLRIQCTCEDLLLILYQSSTHPGYMAVEGTSSGSLYSGTLICRGDNPASI